MVQRQNTREIEIEKLITLRSWKKCTAYLREPKGRSRQFAERQDLGHMPLSRSMGEVLWGSQARDIFKTKEWVLFINKMIKWDYLLIPIIALSNGYMRHTDAGKQRKLLVTRAIREVISETYVIL